MAETDVSSPKRETGCEGLQEALERYPRGSDDVIGLLREAQEACGYLAPEVLEAVAEHIGVPWARVYGVASFYGHFHLEPRGRHNVIVCRGTACHVRGGKRVLDTAKRELGIQEGETTEDFQFTLETVACLGACALAPVMVVDGTYYGKMNERRAETVLQSYRQESE